jgi:protein-S-isoprenylcysteine O-methyltransferase Ste14
MKRWIVPILVLPGSVLILIPGFLLTPSWRDGSFALATSSAPRFWFGIAAIIPGALLAIFSTRMFMRHGDGTPAPWDPPARLVICGPYRYVRNPMICGVVFLLLAEALVFQSDYIMSWAVVFWLANNAYFRLVEELRLQARFGEDYMLYCKHVRRWLPRLRAWHQE